MGEVPLTPIIVALLECNGPIDGYNQSAVVLTPAQLTRDTLLGMIAALVERHDMLRAKCEQQRFVIPPVNEYDHNPLLAVLRRWGKIGKRK